VRSLDSSSTIIISSDTVPLSPWSFAALRSLTTVVFPATTSLVCIDGFAFAGSSLVRISIPATVHTIGDSSFSNCESLREVTFGHPSCLNAIDRQSFWGCLSLQSAVLPATLARVDATAFPRTCSVFLDPLGRPAIVAWRLRSGFGVLRERARRPDCVHVDGTRVQAAQVALWREEASEPTMADDVAAFGRALSQIVTAKVGERGGEVRPFVSRIIRCCAEEAGERPTFEQIALKLRKHRWNIISGVSQSVVDAFVHRIGDQL
jgi:hypothetical protein